MDQRVAAIIGDGQMAAQCAKLIAEHDAFVLSAVIHHQSDHDRGSRLHKVCSDFGVPLLAVNNVNDGIAIETLNDVKPDIVFSVNNWDIIHADELNVPRDGIVNFHNGPLPDYRGVHVPSWAIINREKRHGVTWHYVDEKIDGGDIVASKTFELAPGETAISLTLRCIATGVELFSPLLSQYASGTLERRPQDGEGHYYPARTSPPNEGYLDFDQTFDELSALVRGLNFRPFENQFTYPKIRVDARTLLVSEISRFEGGDDHAVSRMCGEIHKIDDRGIVVRAGDGLVRLSGLMEEDLSQPSVVDIANRHGLVPGSHLG